MLNDPRQWSFVADMDYNGIITISDVWLWLKWLYFIPGDYAIDHLLTNYPGFAQFIELTTDNYGGFCSGAVSFFAWAILIAGMVGIRRFVIYLQTPQPPG